jgi:hypothetical protein
MKALLILIFLTIAFGTNSLAQCLNVTVTNSTNVNCFGGVDGTATLTPANGQAPYTYTWNTGTASFSGAYTINGLAAGVYTVTVEDNLGCDAVKTIVISGPSSSLSITTSISSNYNGADISCHSTCDGEGVVTASGGTTNYNYLWSDGSILPTITGMCGGTYYVTVSDANGCFSADSIVIVAPNPMNAQIVIQDTICQGGATSGTLLGVATGGVPVYNYVWSNASIGNPISYNVAGNYCLDVTDVNGCTATTCSYVDTLNFEVHITSGILLGNQKHEFFNPNIPQAIQTSSSYPSQTTYHWTPSTGLSCSNCPSPLVSATTPTEYILNTNHSSLGCTSSDTITMYPRFTDTIELELAPDSTLHYCPSNYVYTGGTSSLPHGSIVYHPSGCFDYTSNGNVQEGVDTLIWTIMMSDTITLLPLNVVHYIDTTVIYLITASCVWPGDANADGITNNFDLLPIGQHHGATGLARTNASINYNCQPARNWGATILGTPNVDLKHVDTDGNALINSTDTNAIILNWAQTHLRNNTSSLTGIDLYVDTVTTTPGDTVRLPIILGNTSVPNGYGIAFTVNYDPAGIDTNTVAVDFNNSWLGTINSDMIGIQKDFYHQGQTEIALTRINQTATTGSGTIAHINFTIKDDVLPKSAFLRLNFDITNIRFIDPSGTIIPVTGVPTQILVTDGLTSTETVLSKQENILTVFPNPTTGQIQIQSLVEEIETILVYNLTGTLLYREENINKLNTSLDLKELPTGIYIANVISEKGMQTVRIIKK